jgi:hypothetical protein
MTSELTETQQRIKSLLDDCRGSLAYAAPEAMNLRWKILGEGIEDLVDWACGEAIDEMLAS